MTGSKILLDTNIIIELFKGNKDIISFLDKVSFINIPSAVLGELYLGAYRSAKPIKHLKQINDFLVKCNVITADDRTANEYAIIKAALLKKGKPIPENDIWIAATAKQHDFKLHTKDKHFKEIEGVQTKFW